MKKVAIIMGSDSDLPVVKGACDCLKKFSVPYEMRIMSAHRTPFEVADFAANAAASGFGVIISAAGKAAHLGGVIAAHTVLPVIGIPIQSSALDGMDALLSTVQMPAGIPVASVAINGAENAALLAIQILASSEPGLSERLLEHRKNMAQSVREKDKSFSERFDG